MTANGRKRVLPPRHHEAMGQAFVELDDGRIRLGRRQAPEVHHKYHRMIAECLADGRQLVAPVNQVTIAEPVARYRQHIEQYYRKPEGSPSHKVLCFWAVLRLLRVSHGKCWTGKSGGRRRQLLDFLRRFR